MSLSLVVGNRSNRVVLGEFWADATKIDSTERVKAERRIRERISYDNGNGARKLVLQPTECKNGILGGGGAGRDEIGAIVELQFLVQLAL